MPPNRYPELVGQIVDVAMVRFLGSRVVAELGDGTIVTDIDGTIDVKLAVPSPITFSLPPPTDLSDEVGSVRVRFFDADGQAGANNITIAATGGALIDGAPSIAIVGNWGAVTLEWRGTYWHADSTYNVLAFAGIVGLDNYPNPANTDSDEFNGTELDADWKLLSLSAIDPAAPARGQAFAGPAKVRVSLTQRIGWLMIQPSSDATPAMFHKALGSAMTQGLLYLKFSMDANESLAGDAFQFALAQTTVIAGETVPDGDNAAVVTLVRDTSDNSWTLQAASRIAGVGATYYNKVLDSFTQPFTRIGIARNGTTFHFYVGSESGGFKHLGSFTSGALNPNRFFILASNGSDPASVYGIDYIRRVDGAFPTV